MKNLLKKFGAISSILIFLFSSLAMGGFIAPASAQQPVQIVTSQNMDLIYTPSMPVWNIYAAINLVTSIPCTSDPPLMWYNSVTNALLPGLARAVSEFPSNDSIILYLVKGVHWYNGSATLPFTAWDVYTEFYIGAKVFRWYAPYMNYSLIKVLNNYTIEFTLNSWSSIVPIEFFQIVISTPYEVWKPILENVTAMNSTKAMAYAPNIEHFVPPAWFLGPYYTTISVPYVIMHLDPQNLLSEWTTVFPYHVWQDYNPEMIIWWTGGNGQTMNGALAGKINWIWCGFSPAQYKVLESSGFTNVILPGYGEWVNLYNPAYYPLNISAVRVALNYAVNRTEATDSWDAYGLNVYLPADRYIFSDATPLPKWLAEVDHPITYNTSYAAQLLESVGFTKKNGQWYMPNGKPFTLSMQLPAGWTDVATMDTNIASQWTEFGVPTTVYMDDVGTYWGSIFPNGDFEVGLWGLGTTSYFTAWGLAGFLGWTGVFNPADDYPFTYPNGTKGIFNCNVWSDELYAATPMSSEYNQSIYEMIAFLESDAPVMPTYTGSNVATISTTDYNITWILHLPLDAQEAILKETFGPGTVNGDTVLYWPTLFGVTPPGVQSPLAEAIATDSLSPEFAAFLGLPPSYSSHFAAAALSTSKISLTASPITVTAGTSTTLTATVTYANGTPASGVSVNFLANGGLVGSTLTGNDGQATFSYTPTSAGTETLSASLAYAPSIVASISITVTKPTTVIPTKVYPTLSLSVSKSSVIQGSPVVLTATATFPNGTPASGYSVGFFANGAGIGTATTGTKGQASFTYT
ncbi:MAG: ABC transporter substrate-binding protein, partial [Thermoprotei archaeon]